MRLQHCKRPFAMLELKPLMQDILTSMDSDRAGGIIWHCNHGAGLKWVFLWYTLIIHHLNTLKIVGGGILKYTCLGEEVYMRSKSCPKSLSLKMCRFSLKMVAYGSMDLTNHFPDSNPAGTSSSPRDMERVIRQERRETPRRCPMFH